MAEIPTFDAKAPRKGILLVGADTGQARMLATVAESASRLTAKIGKLADEATARAYTEKGTAAGLEPEMPGTDYAFDGTSPATTPGSAPAPLIHMRSDIRGIVSTAAQRYGVDPAALMRIAMIESSGNPNAKNPNSSAGGLFQFIDSTAAQYGLTDRFDPVQAADAGARLARDNAAHLRKVLGREPTAGELYLAHQQGAGGAAKLLGNPDDDAVATVGAEAVRLNGGQTGMTNRQFAAIWLRKAGDAPAMSDAGGIKVKLTGQLGAMPRMPSGTIAGDAFNKAASEVYLNRLDTAMRGQMEALAIQHQGDPAALVQSLDTLRAGFVQDLPKEATALVDQTFQRQKMALVSQAANDFNRQLEQQNQAAFEENIGSRMAGVFRMAAKTGLTPQAEAAIAAELGALTGQIDASPLNPLQKSRLKQEAAEGVLSARVVGGFEAQKDAAGRAAYLKGFQDDYVAGKGATGQMSLDSYTAINGKLLARVNQDQADAGRRATAIRTASTGILNVMKKGWAVPDAQLAALKNDVAATGDPELAANFDFLNGLSNLQRAHVGQRPEALDAQIAMLEAKMQREGATDAAVTTHEVLTEMRDNMRKGLSDDPLTWANRAGVTDVESLPRNADGTIAFQNSAGLSAALAERLADAHAVADHYGVQPKFFTASERDSLIKQVEASPLTLPSLVSGLASGLGNDLPAAMNEISKEAPVLAQTAWLYQQTGKDGVAVQVGEMLARRRDPAYKSALPPAAKIQAATATTLGGALNDDMQGLAEVTDTAAALFERRALARGIDMSNFEEGTPARELYMQALDDALGATTLDGVKYGGLTEVNGMTTIAPPDIAADSMQDMLDNLSAYDLAFQPGIGTANKTPINLDQLRGGQLIRASNGRYWIALGDPASGNPQFVANAAGGLFELDIHRLEQSQRDSGMFSQDGTALPRNPWVDTGFSTRLE